MSLIQESSRQNEARPKAPSPYRSPDELLIRAAAEDWGRARWPGRRVIHELGMGRGSVRADIVFVGPDALSAVEIKSAYDNADRLINQLAMFRLSAPDVWLIHDVRHGRDAALMGYLLPSIGLVEASVQSGVATLRVTREAEGFVPDLECLVSLLWVEELRTAASLLGSKVPARATHASLRKTVMEAGADAALRAVCHALRGRSTLWRADAPILDD